jgi:hypothetical protein
MIELAHTTIGVTALAALRTKLRRFAASRHARWLINLRCHGAQLGSFQRMAGFHQPG